MYTGLFERDWKAMGLDDDDLRELEDILLENPQIGDVIEGLGGARKVRVKLCGRGKSGGGRVVYVDVLKREKLYMLLASPKNVQVDLSPEQRKTVRKIVRALKEEN